MFHIVDDELMIRDVLTELISSLGHDVKGFSCPVEYLDYMKCSDYQRPIAILTDVRMPKMSGFEMIKEIREYYPKQKFVVISGYSEERVALGKRACQYIAKPFNPVEVEYIANSMANCHEHGPLPNVTEGCKKQVSEEHLDVWECPLDCFDCDTKHELF